MDTEMASDAYFQAGPDRDALEREMNATIDDIRRKGGEVSDVSIVETTRGEQPWAEARFDYRMPADEIASEVEFAPDSVEDLA